MEIDGERGKKKCYTIPLPYSVTISRIMRCDYFTENRQGFFSAIFRFSPTDFLTADLRARSHEFHRTETSHLESVIRSNKCSGVDSHLKFRSCYAFLVTFSRKKRSVAPSERFCVRADAKIAKQRSGTNVPLQLIIIDGQS